MTRKAAVGHWQRAEDMQGEEAIAVARRCSLDDIQTWTAPQAKLVRSTVEAALDQGALVPLQAADAQISTDLTCGNLDAGAAYCFLDCIGSASVEECLKRPGVSRIDGKISLQAAAQRLTFPEEDGSRVGVR